MCHKFDKNPHDDLSPSLSEQAYTEGGVDVRINSDFMGYLVLFLKQSGPGFSDPPMHFFSELVACQKPQQKLNQILLNYNIFDTHTWTHQFYHPKINICAELSYYKG